MKKRHFSCSSCGMKAEFSPKEPPCKALSGWLVVSHWKGLKEVDHYYFCSFACLKRWADAQTPEIPKVFFKAFGQESRGEDTRL